MNLPKGKRLWSYLGIIIIIVIAGGLFVSFGSPKLYAKSGNPGILRRLPCHGGRI